MDNRLGQFYGKCVNEFVDKKEAIDFISSHGHTIFHHPGLSSTQIGNAAIIASTTGIQTIGHLRNMDTAYGGQGAPLAPMADLYLFSEYDICVNLGGIANISIKESDGIVGFDICGANQFLNYMAIDLGHDFDDKGQIARSGNIDESLLVSLNGIPYCHQAIPKSLDNEQVQKMYLPILDKSSASTKDKLATMVEHIAIQLTKYSLPHHRTMHLAGGGAHNAFLVERISSHCHCELEVVVPEADIINFKEAVLIAMCGALRLHEIPNSLKTITGASQNTVNGVVFLP
jgi:anhydro-N-acetylmuramic acid kinase